MEAFSFLLCRSRSAVDNEQEVVVGALGKKNTENSSGDACQKDRKGGCSPFCNIKPAGFDERVTEKMKTPFSVFTTAAESAIETALDEVRQLRQTQVAVPKMANPVTKFTTSAMTSAGSAVDSALEEINQLRRTLQPHGYTMKEMEVALGIVPSLRLTIVIGKTSNLDNIDEDELTELQLMVVKALRQKDFIEPSLARHKMVFSTLKIDLGLKPCVKLVLQWSPEADLDEDDGDEGGDDPEDLAIEGSSLAAPVDAASSPDPWSIRKCVGGA